ncbi:MAG: MBL fold metallo-hydrolase [Patescibacteria group bacterium]
MELMILGVNSPYPRDGRATLGYLVRHGGTNLLLEAGCGIYRRLLEEGLLPGVSAAVMSHLHYDHCADLPAVALGATVGQGRGEPLPVYLPPGEFQRLRSWLGACGFDFVLEHIYVAELPYGAPVAVGGLELVMRPAGHSLPAGIVTVAAGGRRLVYTGDTRDCPALREALRGADLVLAEAASLPPARAVEKGHLPAGLLGELAREAGAGELIVTHFMQGSDPEALAAEASRSFGRPARMASPGQVYVV